MDIINWEINLPSLSNKSSQEIINIINSILSSNFEEIDLWLNKEIEKKKLKFQEGFKRVTKKEKSKYQKPNIHIETVADMYVFYVQIYGIDIQTFWNSDVSFLDNIVENKIAYENYVSNPKEVK